MSSERAVVLSRFPPIQFWSEQHQRKRKPETTQGFREGYDVRGNACVFKTEKGSSTSTSNLNVVNNHQDIMLATHLFQRSQPGKSCHIDSPFSLNRFHNYRCWNIYTTTSV